MWEEFCFSQNETPSLNQIIQRSPVAQGTFLRIDPARHTKHKLTNHRMQSGHS